MIPYEIIESSVPREPFYPGRHVQIPLMGNLPPFGSDVYWAWCNENFWMVDYEVLCFDKERAERLAQELESLYKTDPASSRIAILLAELKQLRNKTENRTPLEKWQWMAYQMPQDIGGGEATKETIRRYLSGRYRGLVLEAMCGFNCYFADDKHRTLVALDYCKEALLRYPDPYATRILCDLDGVAHDRHLECFEESFDTISICFGFRYLKDPVAVFWELRRHLKLGGRLSLVENPGAGYTKLVLRPFSVNGCRAVLQKAGFVHTSIRRLPIPVSACARKEGWYYYHAEAW